MNTQELFEQMQSVWESVVLNHSKSSKAAHGRARKELGEMKKLITIASICAVIGLMPTSSVFAAGSQDERDPQFPRIPRDSRGQLHSFVDSSGRLR